MKHRYSYETDTNGGSAAARLIRLVGNQKEVLELGTGPGSVTRLLQSQECKVTGIEVDPDSIEICRPFCVDIIHSDLESGDWIASLGQKRFDVIVIADVLEHLREPSVLLKSLERFLRPDGYLVLSVPNVSHLTVVASLLAGRFPYQRSGLLDHTHLRFFGREDIDALLRESGFLWHRWEAARLEPIHGELKGFWSRLDDLDRTFLAQRVVDGDVYQHVIAAFPSTAAGHVAKAELELANMSEEMERCKHENSIAVAQFELDLGALKAQVIEADEVLKTLKRSSSNLEVEHKQLQTERASLVAQLHVVAHECQSLQQENTKIENLIDAIKKLSSTDEQRLQEIDELKREREMVFASRSWRVTSPIRYVIRMLSNRL